MTPQMTYVRIIPIELSADIGHTTTVSTCMYVVNTGVACSLGSGL